MDEQNEDDEVIVDGIARSLDLRYPVKVSAELSALLKPNEFLAGLGIRYAERLESVLGLLKGSMSPEKHGEEDTLPKDGAAFTFAIAKGPYIREETITIKAELKNDGGNKGILLTAILKEE